MSVKWQSSSDSWRTPADILDRVRAVFGGDIDLDPASSVEANAEVRARRYHTRADDGLAQPWHGRGVYCNPPGGKRGNRSIARMFWEKLIEERPNYGHAIFAAFSVEALQTTQASPVPILSLGHVVCIPAKRVRWVLPGRSGASPSHASAFVYVASREDRREAFKREFESLGRCFEIWEAKR